MHSSSPCLLGIEYELMILIVEEQGLINIVGEIYYYNILPSKLVVFLMEISRILAWKKKGYY